MKRILSLFLAVLLAFSVGSMAFAAPRGDINGDGKVNSSDALLVLQYSVGKINKIDSAADVNGDGKINSTDALMMLQISVGSATNYKYLATFSLKAKVNSKNYTSNDVISVKPGDTVSVTLSLSNNFYTGPTSAQIYYNKNIFSGAPSAQFNTDGKLYETVGKTYCTFRDWDGLAADVKNDCWPDYSEAKLKDFKANHKFLRVTMTPNVMHTDEVAKNINEDLIIIHFTVDKSAKKGTTGQIIIPIESKRTRQYLDGHLMCSVHESSDITSKSSVYLDDLGYDCSKAVLNFKVA